jgi:hypothetical protein
VGDNMSPIYDIEITAAGSSGVILTYAQITENSFTFYDLKGNPIITPGGAPDILFAYESRGKALDSGTGPVEMCIVTGAERVTDSANFIKKVTRIDIVGS